MSKQALERKKSGEPVIPDKLYFRIGEVAKLCGVEAYVLRFWESEFPQLRPNKSGTGQRLYRKRDVELALRIRQLLHKEGYTIAGARQVFAQAAQTAREDKKISSPKASSPGSSSQTELALHSDGTARVAATLARLQRLRAEMRDLLGVLSAPPPKSARDAKPRTLRTERPNLFE